MERGEEKADGDGSFGRRVTYRTELGKGLAVQVPAALELLVYKVCVEQEVGDRVLVHHRDVTPREEVLENAHVNRNQFPKG